MELLRKSSAWCTLFFLMLSQANAVTIPYTDQTGTDVTYVDISESNAGTTALFGQPSIVGNTLDFDPTDFRVSASSSTGTNESNVVDGQLNATVMSTESSYNISQIIINEQGDFTLTGLGSAQATATVGARVLYSITHVDGMVLTTPIGSAANLAFSPNSGSFALPGDAGTAVGWTGNLTIDIAALAATNGINGNVTKVKIAMDNVLTAAAANGGSATIAKKDFNGVTITVPEPSSTMMLGLCVFCLGITVRRIRRTRS